LKEESKISIIHPREVEDDEVMDDVDEVPSNQVNDLPSCKHFSYINNIVNTDQNIPFYKDNYNQFKEASS
jgi:hypothetical protein